MKLPSLTISQKYRMWVSKIFVLLMLGLVLFFSHSWARDSLIDSLFESSGLVLIVFCTFWPPVSLALCGRLQKRKGYRS